MNSKIFLRFRRREHCVMRMACMAACGTLLRRVKKMKKNSGAACLMRLLRV